MALRPLDIKMNCRNVRCGAKLPEGANYCPRCGKKVHLDPKKQKSRGNGLGSVYKLPSGKYQAAKTLGWVVDEIPPGSPPGTKPHKRRIVVRRNFRTRRDALEALPFLSVRDRHPLHGTPTARKGERISLKELFDQWEPTHQRSRSTMNCYRSGFRLFAPLWFVPMADLYVDDLQACLDDAEVGKRTLENARAALGLVYKYGIPRNCVPKDRNLAQFLRINAEGGAKKSGFSSAELEKIRAAAEAGDPEAVRVLCHCYLGFRPTALLALTVASYDKTQRAFTGGIKTEAGIGRTVTVSPKIQPYIDRLTAGESARFVFGRPDGTQEDLASYRESFYALLQRLGIDNPTDADGLHRLTPHSCRHTFATLMKRVPGADADKLALIGHTSTEQLKDYQDVPLEDLRRITDAL